MSKSTAYFGRAGQLAVMSEFLVRNWNVAIPEVDIGDDVFVIRDADFNATRNQVKSANGKPYAKSGDFSAQFSVSLRQLATPTRPALWYVLAARFERRWRDFIVIERAELHRLHVESGLGATLPKDEPRTLVLYVRFGEANVTCSGVSLAAWRNNFDSWPVVRW